MKKLFTLEQERLICKRYQDGESTSRISASLQTGHKVILGVLNRNSVPVRAKAKPTSIDHNIIFDLYRSGLSDSEIANQLNCSKSLVQTAIYRHCPEIRRDKNVSIRMSQLTKNREWVNGKPNLKGEKNPQWKGGKTILNYSIRADARYKSWRFNVFERDGYICQFCGNKSQKDNKVILHADHIIPLHELVDIYQIKSIEDARSCDEIWDISNGRTLCRACHKKTPTYGVNAAKNILAAGLAVNVCGATVRPEESKSRKAGAMKQKPKS